VNLKTVHWERCSGHESVAYETVDLNQRITNKMFQYGRCDKCGLIRLLNPPESIGDYYPNTYHDFPSLKRLASIAKKGRCKIDTVLQFMKGGKLLEIGPSYGLFSYQAKEAGFDVRAIEMNPECCDYLEATIGIQVVRSDRPEKALLDIERHDVIALWHVIEHLPDPWALIKAASENLNVGGILVLAAPNPESWQFEKMAEKWPHLDAPRHMYLLPAALLTEFCSSVGLKMEYMTTTDDEAKGWNKFGWQRLLMNRVECKWFKHAAFLTGYILSAFLSPFESSEPKGSAYTMVFRKE
jgi:2-polyprenyl-3-methyl-5-hydroxy-6-metoxy-1,4-benzoquinol methylase